MDMREIPVTDPQDTGGRESITLSQRELATVLHGLRMIQEEGRLEGCTAGNCNHFDEVAMLSDAAITRLCHRINGGAK